MNIDPTIIAIMIIVFGAVFLFMVTRQTHMRADDDPDVLTAWVGIKVNTIITEFINSDLALRAAKFTLSQQYREFEMASSRQDMQFMALESEKRFHRLADDMGMSPLQLRTLQDRVILENIEFQKKLLYDDWERLLEKERRKDNLEVATYAKDYVNFELIRLIQGRMDTLLDEVENLKDRKPAEWQKKIGERMETYIVFKRLKDESEKRVQVDGGPGGSRHNTTSNNAGNRRPPLGRDH